MPHICVVIANCFVFVYTDCPVGTEYHNCSWNLSCSDITGVRRCKEQSLCTSGCFCSNKTVLINGTCSDIDSCSGMTTSMLELQ